MTTSVIELLNPNKYWNIGSNNQVVKLYADDASFNKLHVSLIDSTNIKVKNIDVINSSFLNFVIQMQNHS